MSSKILSQIEKSIRKNHPKDDRYRNFLFRDLVCPKCYSKNIRLTLEVNISLMNRKLSFNIKELANVMVVCNDCHKSDWILAFIQNIKRCQFRPLISITPLKCPHPEQIVDDCIPCLESVEKEYNDSLWFAHKKELDMIGLKIAELRGIQSARQILQQKFEKDGDDNGIDD
jgi:hypothetical protein